MPRPPNGPVVRSCITAALHARDHHVSAWLTNELRSERRELTDILERRHDALVHALEKFLNDKKPSVGARDQKAVACNEVPQLTHLLDATSLTSPMVSHGRQSTVTDRHTQTVEGYVPLDDLTQSDASATDIHYFSQRDGARDKSDNDTPCIEPPHRIHLEDNRISKFVRSVAEGQRAALSRSTPSAASRIVELVELVVFPAIIINIFVLAAETQWQSFNIREAIGYPHEGPWHNDWKGAESVFRTLDLIMGVIFCLEIVVVLILLRQRFFLSPLRMFDALIVLVWVIGQTAILRNKLPFNPSVLRASRAVHLLRWVRNAHVPEIFYPLHVLFKAVVSSVTVLFWALVILFLVIFVSALVVSQSLGTYMMDVSVPVETRTLVFRDWGSFSRAVETMFEVTLGNWGPPCRLLMNNVSEWWMIFFIFFKCVIGFAIVQVITSVFIQQTFKVVQQDEQVMVKEKAALAKFHLKHLDSLFEVIDESNDGYLSLEELSACLDDKIVKAWFAAMDVDTRDVTQVFQVIDNGDGLVSRKEFIEGMKRMKGPATNTGLLEVTQICRRLEKLLNETTQSHKQDCVSAKPNRNEVVSSHKQ
eukprot:TRINITY_DN5385_c0_g1_i1.p1 TRINITY_DN5385_c0_g1~~TRINITY_DN5385_c0_g1_i1.p1  ORF type:complete len:591 (+),score=91.42 TRINITY_DN5385_c0_g1_i1:112-1884(+)